MDHGVVLVEVVLQRHGRAGEHVCTYAFPECEESIDAQGARAPGVAWMHLTQALLEAVAHGLHGAVAQGLHGAVAQGLHGAVARHTGRGSAKTGRT